VSDYLIGTNKYPTKLIILAIIYNLFSSIFGQPVRGIDCGDNVAAWLTKVTNFDVRFVNSP